MHKADQLLLFVKIKLILERTASSIHLISKTFLIFFFFITAGNGCTTKDFLIESVFFFFFFNLIFCGTSFYIVDLCDDMKLKNKDCS